MYRTVYSLVYSNSKNYRDPTFGQIFGLISKSVSIFHKLARKNTHETIGDSTARTGVRSERGVPVRKISSSREVLLWHLQIDFLVYLTRFLEFWGSRGLYITVRDLPRAMRPKLVVIEPARVLFESIFVHRVLRAIPQRRVRARSPDTIWSTQTVFIDLRLTVTNDNGPTDYLRRK